MFSGDNMGLRELVRALGVRLAGLGRPLLFRKEYAVLAPPPVPPPPPPPLALWELWEGASEEVLAEAVAAVWQDVEEQIAESQEMYRGLN